jgi:hypothetical protein
MLKSLTRIFFILLGVDVLLFFCLMGTSMSDQQALPIAGTFYWILHYVAGFPLALIDSRYPFFLQSTTFVPVSLVFVAVNNAILALLIWWIFRMLKKLWR